MKKIICTIALVSVAAFSTYAQNQKQDSANVKDAPAVVEGPKIEFEKMVHDYGQIVQGANGDCEFKFKNIGNEPLVLTNVQSSCGCTTPSWPREPILPGKEASIKVHYDTNRVGHIGKSVTVFSNSVGGVERVSLRLAGNVNPKQN